MTSFTEEDVQQVVLRTLEGLQIKSGTTDSSKEVYKSPLYKIGEFRFNPDSGCIFKTWYERHQEEVESDSGPLKSDNDRRRFIVSKLGQKEYNDFTKRILPKKVTDFEFEELLEELYDFFDAPTTLFRRRLGLFETTMGPEGLRELRTKLKHHASIGDLETCTPDEILCFLAINAMKDTEWKYAKLRAVNYLETKEDPSFDGLIDDLIRYETIRKDSAVTVRPKPVYQVNDNPKPERSTSNYACYRCGGKNHTANQCRYRNETCSVCKKKGHLAKVCRQAKNNNREGGRNPRRQVNQVRVIRNTPKISLIQTTVKLNGYPVKMAIDTGAEVSLINRETWQKMGSPKLKQSPCKLTVANGSSLHSYGVLKCEVGLKEQTFRGECHVTDNCSLLGLDWIKEETEGLILNPELLNYEVFNIQNENAKEAAAVLPSRLKRRFPKVIDDGLGLCTKYQARIFLKPDSIPVFRKARPVAYASLPSVEKEIERLEKMGVLERVNSSLFAAPIVIVKKQNGTIRLCADYSTGLNAAIEDDTYPLPTAEDIFNTLNGGRLFSKIDLSEAYLQVQVEESSQALLTINTPKGLYKYKRLPFGVKTAPSIFQRLMDTAVADLEGTTAYLDDIIVTSRNEKEHEDRIFKLFKRLQEFGLKVRLEKCNFMDEEIKYLGFIINKQGRKPDPEKTKAIIEMKQPTNIGELRAFLGMINFYNSFVPDMATLREPLNALLKKDTTFQWNEECENAFRKTKEILQSDLLLTHFNPNLPISISADASGYGLGAVILHQFPDGKVKAIQHAARSLTPAEKKYAQIEKEALALVFAVRKFHKYIYGRRFTLNTDHKPLITIFKPGNGISAHSANRLQRWALILVNYDFEIHYINTKNFGEADALSRLIDEKRSSPEEEDTIIACVEAEITNEFKENMKRMPVTAETITNETKKDKLLQTTIKYTTSGQWPKMNRENELYNLYTRQDNLSVIEDCLAYKDRIVIPKTLQDAVMKTLHEGHPGMTKMKNLARQFVFWPRIDEDIEMAVKKCDQCQRAGPMPKRTALEPWPTAQDPWKRIHMDFAGPMNGFYYFIVVDSYSKWPEIMQTKSITSEKTIDMLDEIFTRHGFPEELVSDNGTQFTSSSTKEFCAEKGIKQIFTAPYSPMSNGQAERFVDTFKRSFKKMEEERGSLQQKLRVFLRSYRNTPARALDNKCPAEVLMGRRLRSQLDLLKPTATVNAVNASAYTRKMKDDYDQHHGATPRSFKPEDTVYATRHRNNRTEWVPGKVQTRYSSVNYEVDIEGKTERKHANQLKPRYGSAGDPKDSHDGMEQLAIDMPYYERPRGAARQQPSETEEKPRITRPERSPDASSVSYAVQKLDKQIDKSSDSIKRALAEAISAVKRLRISQAPPTQLETPAEKAETKVEERPTPVEEVDDETEEQPEIPVEAEDNEKENHPEQTAGTGIIAPTEAAPIPEVEVCPAAEQTCYMDALAASIKRTKTDTMLESPEAKKNRDQTLLTSSETLPGPSGQFAGHSTPETAESDLSGIEPLEQGRSGLLRPRNPTQPKPTSGDARFPDRRHLQRQAKRKASSPLQRGKGRPNFR